MAIRGKKVKIDLAELEKLCSMQATDEEVAAFFNVSTRTIERRRKVKRFADVMERGRAKGRLSIRRMQIRLLEQGNGTMGVWLGKQVLGQRETDVAAPSQIVVIMPQGQAPPAIASVTEPLPTGVPRTICCARVIDVERQD